MKLELSLLFSPFCFASARFSRIEAENLRDLYYTFDILKAFYNSKEFLDQF